MIRPEWYIKSNRMQKVDAQRTFDAYKHLIDWEAGERVLDVGCGPGDVTSALLKPMLAKNAVLVGADISKEMIEYAEKFYSTKSVSFKLLNIVDPLLPSSWTENKFDKIFSFYCFHWIQDQKKAFQNLNSLLNPGGMVFILFAIDTPLTAIYESLLKISKWKSYSKILKEPISQSKLDVDPKIFYQALLADLDFTVLDLNRIQREHIFISVNEFLDSFKAINPISQILPKDLLEEFTEDFLKVCQEVQTVIFSENGSVKVQYDLFCIHALKNKEIPG